MTSERERERGRIPVFGRDGVGASPSLSWDLLEGARIIHKDSTNSLLPRSSKAFDLTQAAHPLFLKHSSMCHSLSTEVETVSR